MTTALNLYTGVGVKHLIDANEQELFASWSVGRPEGWKCDQRTHDIVCIGIWLRQELSRQALTDDDRKLQEQQFNRRSRSEIDLFALAAEIMNQAITGTIDRTRTPTRRWG